MTDKRSAAKDTRTMGSPPSGEQQPTRPSSSGAPPYTPPPSPEGLFYYLQKGGTPDLTTPVKPDAAK